jgi:hypothetical protein
MGLSVFPAPSAASKTRKIEVLTSGTSWTVPAGVTYVNATLIGGGGAGGGGGSSSSWSPLAGFGQGGQITKTTVTTTPGATITYSIGAGGTAAANRTSAGGPGGSTTFTGATTAAGGKEAAKQLSGDSYVGLSGFGTASNGGTAGSGEYTIGAAGGAGCIELEYWV